MPRTTLRNHLVVDGVDLTTRLEELAAGEEGGNAFVSEQAGNTLTGNPLFWVGTQEDYDALTPAVNTIYLIIES